MLSRVSMRKPFRPPSLWLQGNLLFGHRHHLGTNMCPLSMLVVARMECQDPRTVHSPAGSGWCLRRESVDKRRRRERAIAGNSFPCAVTCESRPALLPLLPGCRPESAPDPRVKVGEHRRRLTAAEGAVPAPEVGAKLLPHGLQTHASGPPRPFPDPRLAPGHRGRRQPSARGRRAGAGDPQDRPLPWGATALFAPLTFRLSVVVMKRVRLAIPRCPACGLRT